MKRTEQCKKKGLYTRPWVADTHISKIRLVKPTNPLVVVVVVKQAQHQLTVTLTPASAEGFSSSKLPAGFAETGP